MQTEEEAIELPIEIAPEEVLFRSLRVVDVNRSRMTVKAGALKPGRSDPTSISLIRARIGFDAARQAAVDHVHGDDAWGFGSSVARVLENHCDYLVDDRSTFWGHADMRLGFSIPAGPPNTPPDMTQAYEDAIAALIALAARFTVEQHPPEF